MSSQTTCTLSRLAASAALKREQVGVVTIAPQAQVRPPDVVAAMCVEDELGIGQLHHTWAQFVPIVVHVYHLHRYKWQWQQQQSERSTHNNTVRERNTQQHHSQKEVHTTTTTTHSQRGTHDDNNTEVHMMTTTHRQRGTHDKNTGREVHTRTTYSVGVCLSVLSDLLNIHPDLPSQYLQADCLISHSVRNLSDLLTPD